MLPEHQHHADHAGQERGGGEDGERGAGPADRREPVQQDRGRERGERARDAEEHRSTAEETAAQAVRDEVAHPRHPRAVADHARHRADRDDAEEEVQLGGRVGLQRGQCQEREERQARDPDGPEGHRLAAARAREPGGGQARHLGPQRQRAEEADHRRARAQVECPAGDDRPGGAGGEDLGEGALGHRGIQRAAERTAGRRGLSRRAVRIRRTGQRGAGGRERFAGLRDREGGSDAGERGQHDGGAERFHVKYTMHVSGHALGARFSPEFAQSRNSETVVRAPARRSLSAD